MQAKNCSFDGYYVSYIQKTNAYWKMCAGSVEYDAMILYILNVFSDSLAFLNVLFIVIIHCSLHTAFHFFFGNIVSYNT